MGRGRCWCEEPFLPAYLRQLTVPPGRVAIIGVLWLQGPPWETLTRLLHTITILVYSFSLMAVMVMLSGSTHIYPAPLSAPGSAHCTLTHPLIHSSTSFMRSSTFSLASSPVSSRASVTTEQLLTNCSNVTDSPHSLPALPSHLHESWRRCYGAISIFGTGNDSQASTSWGNRATDPSKESKAVVPLSFVALVLCRSARQRYECCFLLVFSYYHSFFSAHALLPVPHNS